MSPFRTNPASGSPYPPSPSASPSLSRAVPSFAQRFPLPGVQARSQARMLAHAEAHAGSWTEASAQPPGRTDPDAQAPQAYPPYPAYPSYAAYPAFSALQIQMLQASQPVQQAPPPPSGAIDPAGTGDPTPVS